MTAAFDPHALRQPLIDSHCHLDLMLERLGSPDLPTLLRRYRQQNVSQIIIPGLTPHQWPQLASLCETHPELYFAIGIHPWWLAELCSPQYEFKSRVISAQTVRVVVKSVVAPLLEQMHSLSEHPRCVAVGECGLDGLIDLPIQLQMAVLQSHLELANASGLPLIVHSRRTHHHLLQLFKKTQLRHGGVLHGFSGPLASAKGFIAHNLSLGIGGTITYTRARQTRLTCQKLPLASCLLETDAPDMPLSGHQGRPNSPLHLQTIRDCLANLRSECPEIIAKATTANAQALFPKLNGSTQAC